MLYIHYLHAKLQKKIITRPGSFHFIICRIDASRDFAFIKAACNYFDYYGNYKTGVFHYRYPRIIAISLIIPIVLSHEIIVSLL